MLWIPRSIAPPSAAIIICHEAIRPRACIPVYHTTGLNLQHTHYPFEVLAVLRLRLLRGLKNPSLEHLLTSTPLGDLPEVTEFYTDELLEGVVKQARLEFQDL
jgi:hypothetical protein